MRGRLPAGPKGWRAGVNPPDEDAVSGHTKKAGQTARHAGVPPRAVRTPEPRKWGSERKVRPMASLMRGARLGAGLIGLGYGLYRLSQGKRDWTTAAMVGTGLSMALSGRATKRVRNSLTGVAKLASIASLASSRLLRKAPLGPQLMLFQR